MRRWKVWVQAYTKKRLYKARYKHLNDTLHRGSHRFLETIVDAKNKKEAESIAMPQLRLQMLPGENLYWIIHVEELK